MNRNTIKVFSLLAIISILTGNLHAQVQWGIRAGANFSNVIAKDENNNKLATTLLPGFQIGVTAGLPLSTDFFVEPALMLNTKGYKYQESSGSLKGTGWEMPFYAELPVNFLYKPVVGNGRLLLGAGPYLGYGVGGKWKLEFKQGTTSLSQKGSLDFRNDASTAFLDSTGGGLGLPDKVTYAKPFDFGAGVLAGYEFAQRISISLQGQLGLINISPTIDNRKTGATLKNMQFGLSVGYKF